MFKSQHTVAEGLGTQSKGSLFENPNLKAHISEYVAFFNKKSPDFSWVQDKPTWEAAIQAYIQKLQQKLQATHANLEQLKIHLDQKNALVQNLEHHVSELNSKLQHGPFELQAKTQSLELTLSRLISERASPALIAKLEIALLSLYTQGMRTHNLAETVSAFEKDQTHLIKAQKKQADEKIQQEELSAFYSVQYATYIQDQQSLEFLLHPGVKDLLWDVWKEEKLKQNPVQAKAEFLWNKTLQDNSLLYSTPGYAKPLQADKSTSTFPLHFVSAGTQTAVFKTESLGQKRTAEKGVNTAFWEDQKMTFTQETQTHKAQSASFNLMPSRIETHNIGPSAVKEKDLKINLGSTQTVKSEIKSDSSYIENEVEKRLAFKLEEIHAEHKKKETEWNETDRRWQKSSQELEALNDTLLSKLEELLNEMPLAKITENPQGKNKVLPLFERSLLNNIKEEDSSEKENKQDATKSMRGSFKSSAKPEANSARNIKPLDSYTIR